jgi:hypothetical protein
MFGLADGDLAGTIQRPVDGDATLHSGQRCTRAYLRAQLEAHALPLIELAESPDSPYVSFIEQLQRAAPSTFCSVSRGQ